MDVAGSTADVASDLGFSSVGARSAKIHEQEGYVGALVSASLRIVRKGLPVEIQRHGVRMLQHLLDFRKEELSISEFADLRKNLGGSLHDFCLEGTTTALDNPTNSKENSNYGRNLLVLAANNSSSSLATTETDTVIGKTTVGETNLSSESGISSNLGRNSDRSIAISNEVYCCSWSEDNLRSMNNRDDFGDMTSTINSCKEFVEFAYSGMPVNCEMMSSHQGKGSLLLVEHNMICQAFLIVKLYSQIHQYEEILHCLLSLLNKIWTLPEWRSKYLHHGSGLTCLFSDSQFLKMVYHLIKFCEEEFQRSRTEDLTPSRSCECDMVTLLQLILPLHLELLQCIHGLWYPTIACNLSEEIEMAKHPDPSFPFECTAKSVCTMDEEVSQEKETRVLLEEIRESGYYLIGLCTSFDGAFSRLLNGLSVSVALSKYLGSLEFRHLKKLIKLTIIPLVKNCPCKFWKEWVDNLLQPLLRHCEKILHYAWSGLLHHGCAGVSYYFGKLSGSDKKVNTREYNVLVEFTREVSGLLEVLALTEQNGLCSHDTDSTALTSLFSYLTINDCFGKLRMGLFGYFVDDTATAKSITFCRALVCLAVARNDARLRMFILENLLPCLIQSLDNQLPCAIQSLKYKLNSGASVNASRHLVVLARELYGYMLNSGYVQTQALAGEDKNRGNVECSFEVWLERQKEIFRVKAYSAAAKEFPKGYRWNLEFEDECQRYLPVYIDMLQEVDAIDDFTEHIYLEKERLFQKLSPEFRSKYAISSSVHPFMKTISSIQQRKLYSMAAVARTRKICNFVRKLIKLKPYIKGSDCSFDVIYRLKRTCEVPPELSKCVVPSVELLLHSILFFWEPRFHPMIREAHMDKLLGVVNGLTESRLTESECLKPVAPIIRDFPLHLQPYARALIETKLKESKYYIAKEQILLHEEFDKYLASGALDDYMDRFRSSKDCLVEELVLNKLFPCQFWALEHFLIKLSFERRSQIVHMQTEICTYAECLRVLLQNERLKFQVESLISELEAEGFFYVDSEHVNWGNTYFAELIDKFSYEAFAGNSLPKHYAIRGLIDCRTILLHKDGNWQEAFEKVVVDVCNDLIGYLPKFWKDTSYYEHQYYAIIRDPLKQVISGGLH